MRQLPCNGRAFSKKIFDVPIMVHCLFFFVCSVQSVVIINVLLLAMFVVHCWSAVVIINVLLLAILLYSASQQLNQLKLYLIFICIQNPHLHMLHKCFYSFTQLLFLFFFSFISSHYGSQLKSIAFLLDLASSFTLSSYFL